MHYINLVKDVMTYHGIEPEFGNKKIRFLPEPNATNLQVLMELSRENNRVYTF